MTALVGQGETVESQDQWVYDQSADTYALDEEMAAKLQAANPEAFRNIVGRMLEAHGRGMWDADQTRSQRLRELYDISDRELEGIKQ